MGGKDPALIHKRLLLASSSSFPSRFIYLTCMDVLPAYMSVRQCVSDTDRGQKRVRAPLELG